MSDSLDPSKLKVAELRAELEARGLDTEGNKPVLVERLREALEHPNDEEETDAGDFELEPDHDEQEDEDEEEEDPDSVHENERVLELEPEREFEHKAEHNEPALELKPEGDLDAESEPEPEHHSEAESRAKSTSPPREDEPSQEGMSSYSSPHKDGESLEEKDFDLSHCQHSSDNTTAKDEDIVVKEEVEDKYYKMGYEDAPLQDMSEVKEDLGNEYDGSMKIEEIYIKEELMESKQGPHDTEDRRGENRRALSRSHSPDSKKRRPEVEEVRVEDEPENDKSPVLLDWCDDEDNVSTKNAGKGDEGTGLQKRRKKSPCVLLTDRQERMLGNWLQEHPFLYDRGLTDFKEVAKKRRLLAEKAKSLDPPLTGPQLSTWLKSIRTRYGRLTKGKSRGAERGMTEREKWILSEFKFFGKHIFRQKKPKTLGLEESAAAAAAALSEEPGKVVVSGGGDEDEVTVIPAIEEQRPKRKQRCERVRQQGEGFVLEKMIENAEAAKKAILEKIECNPKEDYWKLHLKKVAKDCAEIDPIFYPYLQAEIGFLVQKLQNATKEGRLTANFDMFPNTRQMFLEMEQDSSTRSFPSHPPAPSFT